MPKEVYKKLKIVFKYMIKNDRDIKRANNNSNFRGRKNYIVSVENSLVV